MKNQSVLNGKTIQDSLFIRLKLTDNAIALPDLQGALNTLIDYCDMDISRAEIIAAVEQAMDRYPSLAA